LPPLPHKDRNRLEEIIVWNARCFQLHLKCTAYSIGAFALLEYLLNRWLPSKAESFIPLILIGNENLQTAAQGISLWRLASHAQTYPALRKILETDFDWSVIAQQISNVDGGPQFLSLLQAFLDANGGRAAGEFELAVPRWGEDPTFVVNVIRKFLETRVNGSPSFDPTMWHSQRQKAISHIKSFLPAIQRLTFSQLLASYADFCTLRENIKYRLMEGYSLLREVFLEIGTQLKANRIVELASDIFFLRPAEIMALSAGDCQPQQITVLISERKAQHAHWEARYAPDLIFVGGNEELNLQKSDLTGIGCSPGVVEGIARVLFDISEADTLEPGEILVAPHTEPGWTPLFLSCKAVVTEIGGFLSHGATVAREYGIPAVANVTGVTQFVKTGDVIQVDGTKGLVTICESKN
jgi:phosphohistidine swiveling domain-containing protein